MKKIIYFLFALSAYHSFAQNSYQTGYFINNAGTKTECFIKNIGWKNNPEDFLYKLTEEAETQTQTIKDVTEFSVNDAYTFKRFTVNIDRSSDITSDINSNKEPQYKLETLYLKVLVEGKANLYEYEDGSLVKYFMSTGNHNEAEQIFFKQYRDGNTILQNTQFRGQLYNVMKNELSDIDRFKKVDYSKKPLVNLFMEYNNKTGETVKNLNAAQNKANYNLKINGGGQLASLSIIKNDNTAFDFDDKITVGIGFEFEYFFAFSNNKWALYTNPYLSSYKNEGTDNVRFNWFADFTYLDIPLGVRYYMYLNNKSRLFLNLACSYSLKLGESNISFTYINPPFSTNDDVKEYNNSNTYNINTGVGYSFGRYSAELRYNFKRSVLKNFHTLAADYSNIGVVVGYKLF